MLHDSALYKLMIDIDIGIDTQIAQYDTPEPEENEKLLWIYFAFQNNKTTLEIRTSECTQ